MRSIQTLATLLLLTTTAAPASAAASPDQQLTFANPLYPGADPWIIYHDGSYYLCQSAGNGVAVYKSRELADRGQRVIVWRAPAAGWNSRQIWAPELHYLRGKWYIYYAGSDGDNANHRMGVLEAATDDPQGAYIDRGVLYTGDDIEHHTLNRWAIDGTVLEFKDKLYAIWSGWQDTRDIQFLYIATMKDPCTISSNRVRLCANDTYDWERVGDNHTQRGLQEGPAILLRNGRVFIIYSCSGSWQPTYKLGMLYANAESDPMDPKSWTKADHPVFRSTADVFGVGHCSFTTSPDGKQDLIVYHSKVSRDEGWNRVVRIQAFTWGTNGLPVFGQPLSSGAATTRPAGRGR